MFFSALTYGHGVGDKALQEIANKLKKQFGTGNSVIRLGVDEFVVLLPRMLENQFTFIQKKVQLINTELQNPQNNLPKMSVSAGVAFSTKGYSEDLYKRADAALYVTKQTGITLSAFSLSATDVFLFVLHYPFRQLVPFSHFLLSVSIKIVPSVTGKMPLTVQAF